MKKAPFDLRKIKKPGLYKAAQESPSLQFVKCGQSIIHGMCLGMMKQTLKRIEQRKRLPAYYFNNILTEHPVADILRKQEYYKLFFGERW